MDCLMENVKINKKLVNLNVSYNNIMDSSISVEEENHARSQLIDFLKCDTKLIHLDLSSTNLNENIIMALLPAIKKSKSLQAVHLSGNQGVNERTLNEARRVLKTDPNEAKRSLNLVNFFDQETKERYHSQWLRESVKIKHISAGKSLVQNGATDDKFIDFGSKMILMRKLSHKDEIPGSGRWQLLTRKQDNCWICEREMKGYIFWMHDTASKSPKLMNLSLEEKRRIFRELDCPRSVQVQNPLPPTPFVPPPDENARRGSKAKKQQE